MAPTEFTVIGAGPAGLAAAHELARRGCPVTVCEQDGQVGGLARTVVHNGFRFDIGGHRFFTRSAEVDAFWHETLSAEFLRRPRLSRIHCRGKLFTYPLRPVEALLRLGPLTSLAVLASFLRARAFPKRPETSFEDWVSNRFGRRLFGIFFGPYTEKVWGIPCSHLSADWAAQRIRNLSLGRAILNSLGIGGRRDVASLIDEFDYPRLGPGQMYECVADRAAEAGAQVLLNSRATGIRHEGGRVVAVRTGRCDLDTQHLVSTMPLSELVMALDPPPPPEVVRAAQALRYRSILTVNLVIDQAEVLPDTWVYLHSPEIRAARMQLYKNWSPHMVPDQARSSIGMEYFLFESDREWRGQNEEWARIAREDLRRLGIADAGTIADAFVVRYAKAYPIYGPGYRERVELIRDYLDGFANLVPAGRYGQFRYNNMDHSIMTGWLAARRLMGEDVDPWAVNEEAQYHEERHLSKPVAQARREG